MPLYYKLILANGAVAMAAVVASTLMVARAVRLNPHVATAEVIWPILLVALTAGGIINALVVRFALAPLRSLVSAAEQIEGGAEAVRAADSIVADRAMQHVLNTFNAMLDRVGEYRARVRDIGDRALDAGEAERLRISRELHDDTAQTLAALLLQLRVLRSGVPDDVSERLGDVAVGLSEVIDDLRGIAQELRPPALDMIGLGAAVATLARTTAASAGLRIEVQDDGVDGILSAKQDLALYRLAQEALSNVVRHSAAALAQIHLYRRGSTVTAVISDNGVGFDPAAALAGHAIGLLGMQERAAYVGGTVRFDSSPRGGTRVTIDIPSDKEHNG
jgi:two-component system sensor histidine kinase UhpB